MNQSSVIFGALFVAFLVFITLRGELPTYAGFLLSTPKGGATPPVGKQADNSGSGVSVDQVAQAAQFAAFLA